jgi:hypothetical protein
LSTAVSFKGMLGELSEPVKFDIIRLNGAPTSMPLATGARGRQGFAESRSHSCGEGLAAQRTPLAASKRKGSWVGSARSKIVFSSNQRWP